MPDASRSGQRHGAIQRLCQVGLGDLQLERAGQTAGSG